MNRFQKESLKARLLKLVMLKCTGTPTDLAIRLEISVRSVKRFVKEMRDDGTPIRYCHSRRSYVTEGEYQ